jgi:hypothetical protein
MSPKMYALIDQNVFHLNIAPTTPTPAYPNKYNPDGALVPYSREEKSTIDAIFELTKNYFGNLEEHLPRVLQRTRQARQRCVQSRPANDSTYNRMERDDVYSRHL